MGLKAAGNGHSARFAKSQKKVLAHADAFRIIRTSERGDADGKRQEAGVAQG
jgi:hypothetical protein